MSWCDTDSFTVGGIQPDMFGGPDEILDKDGNKIRTSKPKPKETNGPAQRTEVFEMADRAEAQARIKASMTRREQHANTPQVDGDATEKDERKKEEVETSGDENNGLSQNQLEQFYSKSVNGEFPKECRSEAFYGISGEITRMICEKSECKPEAVLAQLITISGNILERGLYLPQGRDHRAILNTVITGEANSAKGESGSHVRHFFEAVAPNYSQSRVQGGFQSGESLIDAVGDAVTSIDKETGELVVLYEDQPKELVVFEEEFARLMKVSQRNGNSITEHLRALFDSPLKHGNKSRTAQRETTGAHVSTIGHITPHELREVMKGSIMTNGFASRFLWIASQRTDNNVPRPKPIDWDSGEYKGVKDNFIDVLKSFKGEIVKYDYTEQGGEYWDTVLYPLLKKQAQARGGLLGSILVRGMTMVARLAMIFAALDDKKLIDVCHLKAAHALWDYSVESVRWIFGDNSGNWRADAIVQALRRISRKGITRTQIAESVFNKNVAKTQLDHALSILSQHGQARFKKQGKAQIWYATGE